VQPDLPQEAPRRRISTHAGTSAVARTTCPAESLSRARDPALGASAAGIRLHSAAVAGEWRPVAPALDGRGSTSPTTSGDPLDAAGMAVLAARPTWRRFRGLGCIAITSGMPARRAGVRENGWPACRPRTRENGMLGGRGTCPGPHAHAFRPLRLMLGSNPSATKASSPWPARPSCRASHVYRWIRCNLGPRRPAALAESPHLHACDTN